MWCIKPVRERNSAAVYAWKRAVARKAGFRSKYTRLLLVVNQLQMRSWKETATLGEYQTIVHQVSSASKPARWRKAGANSRFFGPTNIWDNRRCCVPGKFPIFARHAPPPAKGKPLDKNSRESPLNWRSECLFTQIQMVKQCISWFLLSWFLPIKKL